MRFRLGLGLGLRVEAISEGKSLRGSESNQSTKTTAKRELAQINDTYIAYTVNTVYTLTYYIYTDKGMTDHKMNLIKFLSIIVPYIMCQLVHVTCIV